MKLGSGQRKMSSRLLHLAMAGGISFGFIGGAFPNCDSDVQGVLVNGMEGAAISVIEGLDMGVGVEGAAIAIVESLFQSVRPNLIPNSTASPCPDPSGECL